MKRWILVLGMMAVALPSMASAGTFTADGPGWLRPIVRQPVFGPPAVTTSHGAVYTAPYGAEDLQGATYLGPAHLGIMSVNVSMQMRNEAGLLLYAAAANDPHSLYYRRFLTPQQIADAYGASSADYARALQYFWNQGLGVRAWRQREMIRVVGTQALVERAFGTHFGWYRKNGVTFYAVTAAPRFGMPLAVRGLGGMVTFRHFRRHLDVGGSFSPYQGFGGGFLFGLSPFQLAAAFDYIGAYNLNATCCKGDGITIGIVGTGPISAFDVPAYRATFSSIANATGKVNQVDVTAVMPCCYSNGLTVPPPVTAPCSGSLPGCNPEDLEAQLDTEQTSSLAPNSTINFYLAYNPNECRAPGTCAPGAGSPQLGIGETDDELQQIADDNVADAVSASYGIGILDWASSSNPLLTCPSGPTGCTGAEPDIFATMAAQGMAVFYSSGDTGASGCQRDGNPSTADVLCASYPSGDLNVVSVGATTSPIGSDGRFTGILSVWGLQTGTGGASGGMWDSYIARPAYEPAGKACATNGVCDSAHRLQPDFSLNGDLATGDAVIINCGSAPPGCGGLGGAQIGPIGGTSASAPGAAAMWALVLEACKQTPACATAGGAHPYRLGNPAPLLYGLSAANKSSVFFDVVYGENAVPNLSNPLVNDAGFLAHPGWDAASGLGAPFARNLIRAIVGI